MVLRIKLSGVEYKEDTMGDVRVTVSAGEVWDDFVGDTVAQGFWGLENLSYIPGTVGATPVQNVGAYGVSIADVIEWVEGQRERK
jgi:UDP-N-acetylmuramate dehydrogenase